MRRFYGGVHFKIIFGKIRGREMHSVGGGGCVGGGGGGIRVATEPYISRSWLTFAGL